MNRREFLASSAAAGAGALVLSGCATGNTDPLVGTAGARASGAPSVYEMRVYHFNDGKGEALLNRFRHHTLRLFKKHGIESVGYWLPVDAKDQRLHFLLRYPSREAREASWKAFMADPEWQAAYKASEANGALVKKAETPFLVRTDYSPVHTSGNVSKGGVFELRTYTTPPGRLANLDARFRDHTLALFARHGMHNWLYFHKMPDQPEADVTLVYFLTHASQDAAKASFAKFGADPEWKKAREESEKNAGGSLTVAGGVKSVFLRPTEFSPTR
ncbi:MAG: NIPSNAP family protein [Verrucomicrobia bacterium]|nr:MAG: NIPSNAP family protein [Verrucomicrobiota bacterium]